MKFNCVHIEVANLYIVEALKPEEEYITRKLY
jgi:hypothetical protein